MNDRDSKTLSSLLVRGQQITAASALFLGSGLVAVHAQGTDNRAPEVPDTITVDPVNKVHFHGYAQGFQIYTWNGSSWGAAVPDATLFDADDNVVATHFGTPQGPAWRSNSGSQVVGSLPPASATVDTNSIPWLRLAALTSTGPGVLADTTFIHRVNTVGGKAPAVAGAFVGQVARIPYTADYFFYHNPQQ